MKLVSFHLLNLASEVKIGAVDTDKETVTDLNSACLTMLRSKGGIDSPECISNKRIPSDMVAFLEGGESSLQLAADALAFAKGSTAESAAERDHHFVYLLSEVKLLAPVPLPNSIRDTLSFEGHMINFERRTGKKTPALWWDQPIYYKGNRRSVIGPEETVQWPAYTEKLDYELEFAIVIGKQGRDISVENASEYIAGYTIFNDISARDIIPKEVSMNLGPAKGKDFDRGNVLGPWLVTPDELDANNLAMEARINGEVWSRGNTSDMFHKFPSIISYISQGETLYPGDVIGSGTVANGCGDEMEKWIKPGDVVELEVEGLGVLRNKIGKKETS